MLRFVFIPILFILSCKKPEVNTPNIINVECDNIVISQEVLDLKQDIESLYFDEILKNKEHHNYNKAHFEENELKNIYNLFQLIYEIDTPMIDTLFSYNKLFNTHQYYLNQLFIAVDTNFVHIKNLSNNIFPTNNASLDSFKNNYYIENVELRYPYQDSLFVLKISFQDNYNFIPIAKELKLIEGIEVVYGYENYKYFTDGSFYSIDRTNEVDKVTFCYGKGDCPSGCFHHENYEFEIIDCKAHFIRKYID